MAEPGKRSPLQVDQLRVLGNACAHERTMHQGLNCTPWQRAETILWALQQDGWDLSRATPEVSAHRPTDRSKAVGAWWVADKRGQGRAHRIGAITGELPPVDEASSLPRYDYRLWSSICGDVQRSAFLFSVPPAETSERCVACAETPIHD